MPEANRHLNFLERKTPRLRVNFGVNHQTIGGGAPGLALTFEASLEGGDAEYESFQVSDLDFDINTVSLSVTYTFL